MIRTSSRLMHSMAATELQNLVDGFIYDDHYAPEKALREALLAMMSDHRGTSPNAPTIVNSVLARFPGTDWMKADETVFEELVQAARHEAGLHEHAKRHALVERVVRSVIRRER